MVLNLKSYTTPLKHLDHYRFLPHYDGVSLESHTGLSRAGKIYEIISGLGPTDVEILIRPYLRLEKCSSFPSLYEAFLPHFCSVFQKLISDLLSPELCR